MNYPGRIIKKGESDKTIVKAIQERINELGIANLVVDGDFGYKTHNAVKLYQSRTLDENGFPLIADGKIGPITWKFLFGEESIPIVTSTDDAFLQKVIEIARTQIGELEEPLGSNRGPMVDEYLGSVGLSGGYPWCMGFVYWCFDEAAKELGQVNPLVKTGGCLYQWDKTVQSKIAAKDAVNDPELIVPGAVFIISYGSGLGHTGIVESVQGGYITTIEGNTNNTNSREGIGVFRLSSRKINSVNKGFIICSS